MSPACVGLSGEDIRKLSTTQWLMPQLINVTLQGYISQFV